LITGAVLIGGGMVALAGLIIGGSFLLAVAHAIAAHRASLTWRPGLLTT
jgi:hypothetical protein